MAAVPLFWNTNVKCESLYNLACFGGLSVFPLTLPLYFFPFLSEWGLGTKGDQSGREPVKRRLFGARHSIREYRIGHFRALLCLCFRTSPSANPFIWKSVLHAVSFSCKSEVIFIIFALRLALKQKHKLLRDERKEPNDNGDMKNSRSGCRVAYILLLAFLSPPS